MPVFLHGPFLYDFRHTYVQKRVPHCNIRHIIGIMNLQCHLGRWLGELSEYPSVQDYSDQDELTNIKIL